MSRLLAAVLFLLALPFSARAGWQFNGVPVSTAANYQADPIIVSDGAGGAIIAWIDYRSGTNYDIYAQRLNAAGVPQWTADGIPICTQPGNQLTTSMVSDEAGGAVIVWQDARNLLGNGQEIYAQRVNGSGTVLWTADGVAVCQGAADQIDPVIIKSANNYVMAWSDYRFANQADIYAQALNSSGTPQWLADGVALCTASSNQSHPQIAPDNLGGAVVSWEDRRSGPEDIYARRIDSLGNVQWAANGVVVCSAAAEQYSPQIVGDGAAGGIIAWYDWRSGSPDIYIQRIDQTGSALWTANGVVVCTAPGTQDAPSLTRDFSGGAVVVWEDKRNGANFDIYAQQVNNSGVPQWSANGMPLCTAAGNQSTPRVVLDPAGGFLVTWFDYRTGNPDIYAQRMDYTSTLWTPNGVVLCTESHLQEFPSACPDGTGGAIVAWRDLRQGDYYDVYAEHVNGNGPTTVGRMPPSTALRVSNYPNPFTGETTLQLTLPASGDVNIEVFDVSGRRVREYLLPRQAQGLRALQLDDRDARGAALPSGVYFCRIHAGPDTVTKKIVIAR
jgi:hypothetical protein